MRRHREKLAFECDDEQLVFVIEVSDGAILMLPTRRVALTTQPSRKRVKCQFYTALLMNHADARTRLIHNAQSLSAGVYEEKSDGFSSFHSPAAEVKRRVVYIQLYMRTWRETASCRV